MKTTINALLLNFLKAMSPAFPATCNFFMRTVNESKELYASLADLNGFFYLPNKGNMGDCLIAAATYQYFEAKDLGYRVLDLDAKPCQGDFNLVYGGGGIWHRNYRESYQEIMRVFESPHLRHCVILPSSFYNCDDVLSVLDERFVVFTREEQSFDYCRRVNRRAKFLLADDMVVNADFSVFSTKFCNLGNTKRLLRRMSPQYRTALIKIVYPYYRKARKKILQTLDEQGDHRVGFILRTDRERREVSPVSDSGFDLSLLGTGFFCDEGLDFAIAMLFLGAIDCYDIIVTDRLHVGICAAKLGKTTFLLDNSYGKNSSVYKYSLCGLDNMHLIEPSNLPVCLAESENITSAKHDILKNTPKNFMEFFFMYSAFKNEFGPEKRFWRQ